VGNRYGYQGHVFDPRVGLVDMRNRTYRPSIARFLSRDPIGLMGGSNPYAFVDSSPLLYRDPFGLGKVELGLPPLSPTTTTLEQGYLYERYQEAKRAADNPNNSWFQRIVSGGLAIVSSPVALAEEYLVRQPVNQFVNAGTRAGEHAARAYLLSQQGETAEAFVEGLNATVNASVGFVTGASLAAPAAGAGARVRPPVAPSVTARRPIGSTLEEVGAAGGETTTFYRGMTYGEALEAVEAQGLNAQRIAANQTLNPGAAGSGAYLTTQEATAAYYADLAGLQGRGLGPAVLRMEASTAEFNAFAARWGVRIETPIPRGPFAGATETLVPMEGIGGFNAIFHFFLHK
jgi:RHS repeat-associated protein